MILNVCETLHLIKRRKNEEVKKKDKINNLSSFCKIQKRRYMGLLKKAWLQILVSQCFFAVTRLLVSSLKAHLNLRKLKLVLLWAGGCTTDLWWFSPTWIILWFQEVHSPQSKIGGLCITILKLSIFKTVFKITFELWNVKNSIRALSQWLLQFHRLLFSCGFTVGFDNFIKCSNTSCFLCNFFFFKSLLELAQSCFLYWSLCNNTYEKVHVRESFIILSSFK